MVRGGAAVTLRVCGWVWLFRSALGWLLGLPFMALVGASGVGGLEGGDRNLFEPGGLWFSELLLKSSASLGATFRAWFPYLVLALAVRTLPQGALFAHANQPGSPKEALRAAAARFWPLLAIFGAEFAAKALSVLLSLLLAQGVGDLPLSSSEALRDLPSLAAVLLGGVALGLCTLLADTRRALLFQRPLLGGVAFQQVLSVALPRSKQLAAGYVARLGLSLLIVAVAARMVELCDVSRPGAFRVVLVLLLHQGALFGLTWLEAAWAARVQDACAAQPPATRL
ncbi:MAG: hypothetical protein QM756_13185 [Polyangiaceae bacterium]